MPTYEDDTLMECAEDEEDDTPPAVSVGRAQLDNIPLKNIHGIIYEATQVECVILSGRDYFLQILSPWEIPLSRSYLPLVCRS